MKDCKICLIKYMEKSNRIFNTIKEMFPSASCELIYHNLFELLIAVSLSAQTTDKKVNQVTPFLFEKYPTPKLLGEANFDDIYNIIKPLGLANNKTKNIIELSKILDEKYNSIVPRNREELEALPGVGRKTTNVILMEGFKIPTIPVDTHVSRVSIRLGLTQSDNVNVIEQDLMKTFPVNEWYYVHHGLLFFGRYFCLSKNPKCNECKLKDLCNYNKK